MTNWHNRYSPTPIQFDSPLPISIVVCVAAIQSYAAARLGGVLLLRPEMIWPLWPGCALLVALLLLTPRRIWPAILIAGLSGFALYDIQETLPIRAIVLFLLADTIEILIAALGIRYVFAGVPRLNSVKSLAKYSLFGVVLAPTFVASIAVKAVESDSWWISFFTEALALLTLTPAVLGWVEILSGRIEKPKSRYLEAIAMCSGLTVFSYFTFIASGSENRPAMLYSLVPFLLWAALRFGVVGTSSSITLLAFLAILGVVHGRGPFTGNTTVHNVLSLQLFLLVAACSFMVLAAVVEEYKAAELALGESEERLRMAAQAGKMFAYSWDAATDAIERSGQSVQILGVEQASVATGTAIAAMVHPDDKERLGAALRKLTVENPNLQIVYRIIRPDGTITWLERNSLAYFDANGKLKRVVGMIADVTERKKSEEALADVTRKLIVAQEQERARIGRELHDDINQRLALLAIELQQMHDDPVGMQQRVQQIRLAVAEISNDVQGLSHELHSSKLEYLGVVGGIRSWCKEFGERQGMEITFRADSAAPVPVEIGVTLFRILQEALHNAVKHSGVERIEVQLWEDASQLHLTITDAGKGFDVEAARQGRGVGLTTMEERVKLVNGTIAIESKPTGGTSIRVSIPFTSEKRVERAAG